MLCTNTYYLEGSGFSRVQASRGFRLLEGSGFSKVAGEDKEEEVNKRWLESYSIRDQSATYYYRLLRDDKKRPDETFQKIRVQYCIYFQNVLFSPRSESPF